MTLSLKRLSAIGAIAGVLAFGGIAAAAGTDDASDPSTPTEVVVDDTGALVTATDDATDTTVDGTLDAVPEPGSRPEGRGGRGGGENCGDTAGSNDTGDESDGSSTTEPTSGDAEVTVPQTDI